LKLLIIAHCNQQSYIVKYFAGEWFGRNLCAA
jgi:hypothetical protein